MGDYMHTKNTYFFGINFENSDEVEEVWDAIHEIAYTYKYDHDKIEKIVKYKNIEQEN